MSSSSGARAPSPERGIIVGARYRLESVLGEGGMAVVWRAVHTETDRIVALKLVRPEFVRDEVVREMFVREARVGARIGKNDHIVDVLDAGVDPTLKVPFIAMDLLQGQPLDARIVAGPIPAPLVAELLEQLADGLDQAHAAGVFHRDLKPQNLFLTQDRKGKVLLKIVDFGIAKLSESTMSSATHVGTPAYSAPEQLGESWRKIASSQGKTIAAQVSAATDVWALGLIAYEMLTGSQPGVFWGAQTLAELPVKIVIEPLPRAAVRADPALLPLAFDAWLARCLDLDSQRRWPGARAAVDALVPTLRDPSRVSRPDMMQPDRSSASAPPPAPSSSAVASSPPPHGYPQQPQSFPQHQAQQPYPPQQPIATGPPFMSPFAQPAGPPPGTAPPGWPQQGRPAGPPQGPPPGFQHTGVPGPGMGFGPDPHLTAWAARWRADLRAPGDARRLLPYALHFMPRIELISREARVPLPSEHAVAIIGDVISKDAFRQAMGEDRMLLAVVESPRLAFRMALRSRRSSGGLVDGVSRGLKALDSLVSSPNKANVLGDPHFESQFEVWAPSVHEARAAVPVPMRQMLVSVGFHGIVERFPGALIVMSFHAARFDPGNLDRLLDVCTRLLTTSS